MQQVGTGVVNLYEQQFYTMQYNVNGGPLAHGRGVHRRMDMRMMPMGMPSTPSQIYTCWKSRLPGLKTEWFDGGTGKPYPVAIINTYELFGLYLHNDMDPPYMLRHNGMLEECCATSLCYPGDHIQQIGQDLQRPKCGEVVIAVNDNVFNGEKAQILFDLVSRSNIKEFCFFNFCATFDFNDQEYSGFERNNRPIKDLSHIACNIRWNNLNVQ